MCSIPKNDNGKTLNRTAEREQPSGSLVQRVAVSSSYAEVRRLGDVAHSRLLRRSCQLASVVCDARQRLRCSRTAALAVWARVNGLWRCAYGGEIPGKIKLEKLGKNILPAHVAHCAKGFVGCGATRVVSSTRWRLNGIAREHRTSCPFVGCRLWCATRSAESIPSSVI